MAVKLFRDTEFQQCSNRWSPLVRPSCKVAPPCPVRVSWGRSCVFCVQKSLESKLSDVNSSSKAEMSELMLTLKNLKEKSDEWKVRHTTAPSAPLTLYYPFTPTSYQFQVSPAASPEISHHVVWRTWLFIAYSNEWWLYYQFLLPHLYVSF